MYVYLYMYVYVYAYMCEYVCMDISPYMRFMSHYCMDDIYCKY